MDTVVGLWSLVQRGSHDFIIPLLQTEKGYLFDLTEMSMDGFLRPGISSLSTSSTSG
jgi:hypothetical protein